MLADRSDALHHLRQLAARHDAVLDIIVRRQSAHGAEGAFAAFPEPLALGFIGRELHFARAIALANFPCKLDRPLGMLRRSLDFDDQHRFGVARKTDRRAALHRLDGRPIHDFQRRRNDSRGSDIDDGLGRAIHLIKDREQGTHRFARAHEAHDDFGDDAHGSFGTDEDAAEIIAGRVRSFAAEPNDRAVVEHDFETEHMIGRHAVRKGVRPAGIVGHVAADGTGGLAAGIRGIEIPVFRHSFGHVEVDHAGFDHSNAIFQVDF